MRPDEQNSGFGMSQPVADAAAPTDELELVEIEAPAKPVATDTFVEDVPELPPEPEPAPEPEVEVRMSPKEKRAAKKAMEAAERSAEAADAGEPMLPPEALPPVAGEDTPTVVVTSAGNSDPMPLLPRTVKEMERGAEVVAARKR